MGLWRLKFLQIYRENLVRKPIYKTLHELQLQLLTTSTKLSCHNFNEIKFEKIRASRNYDEAIIRSLLFYAWINCSEHRTIFFF